MYVLIRNGGTSCACSGAGQSGMTSTVPDKSQTSNEKLANLPGERLGKKMHRYSDGCAHRGVPVASW